MKSKRDIFGFFLKLLAKALFFASIIKLSSLCKVSFIFGSKFATFSGSGATMPLTGLFAGGLVSFVICLCSLAIRYVLFGLSSLHLLAFYIPGLCAACYFSTNKLLRISMQLIVPVLCMILFLVHPIGYHAFAYSFFWLIPIVVYATRSKNMFATMLASTFVAHAVGSVIFLYTLGLNAAIWNALIPIVALERLVMASVMFALYKIVGYVRDRFLQKCVLCTKIREVSFTR
ncbi:hypothetical protein ACFLYU_04055 [Candidatus Dependentiae bacterium]